MDININMKFGEKAGLEVSLTSIEMEDLLKSGIIEKILTEAKEVIAAIKAETETQKHKRARENRGCEH